jgi:3D (Asp-Asp-Asp) domain-containing protein
MQDTIVSPRIVTLFLASAGALTFVGCAGTTNLTALSNQNVKAVAKIAEEEKAAETLTVEAAPITPPGQAAVPAASTPAAPGTPASPGTPVPVSQIVGTTDQPAQIAPNDPVAIPKPKPTATPVTLSSVPRTPVENRPTNQIMMVRTTAYTHSESDHLQYGRKSAAGNTLQYGSQVRSAAADWSKYPLGTRFKIEGLPYEYVVDDYGSALVGTETIDIYKPEKGTMNTWGVRNVPIKVIEWGSFEESRKILDERKNVRHADHVREMLREIERKARKGGLSGGNNA